MQTVPQGGSIEKGSGMLVVSLKGSNQQFGIFLGFLELKFRVLAFPGIF